MLKPQLPPVIGAQWPWESSLDNQARLSLFPCRGIWWQMGAHGANGGRKDWAQIGQVPKRSPEEQKPRPRMWMSHAPRERLEMQRGRVRGAHRTRGWGIGLEQPQPQPHPSHRHPRLAWTLSSWPVNELQGKSEGTSFWTQSLAQLARTERWVPGPRSPEELGCAPSEAWMALGRRGRPPRMAVEDRGASRPWQLLALCFRGCAPRKRRESGCKVQRPSWALRVSAGVSSPAGPNQAYFSLATLLP